MQVAHYLNDLIHERGPMTVAAFMDLALYHPDFGYYARAPQRSGRAGDFFTSVDVGPLFGELLATQFIQMAGILTADHGIWNVDLVEAGAGNGRLAHDILRALERQSPDTHGRTRLHLVEGSASARAVHRDTLKTALTSSSADLPACFEGVLIANELLDAMPVHQVVMTRNGLREVYVDTANGTLLTREGPLSTPRLGRYFADLGIALEPGWRADVCLAAMDWIRNAARVLTRGFAILIDYGHSAQDLYSAAHSAGTLTSFANHISAGPDRPPSSRRSWLNDPGERDLTAHVDFTSVRRAAEAEGCVTLGFLDQTYFLMALGTDRFAELNLKQRLALKTLVLPGGLGSTMKVLVLGKGVGTPALTGCPPRARVT